MDFIEGVLSEGSDCKVKKLKYEDDIEDLQELCENCLDYYELLGKESVDVLAGKELFEELAPGVKDEDKILIGMYTNKRRLIGVIEGAKNYPENNVWYIGLLMVDRGYRNIGLGEKFYSGLKKWALRNNVKSIKIGVLEENINGLRFWKRIGFNIVKKIDNYKIENIETTVFVMEDKLK